MTETTAARSDAPDPAGTRDVTAWASGPSTVVYAGLASLGAGAIHAVAAGVHSEHRQAVLAFVVLALAQLGWGAVALARSSRPLALLGIAVNGAAIAGWLLAKTSGVPLVNGLGEREAVQAADALAAALAATAVVAAAAALLVAHRRGGGWSAARPALVAVATVAAVALATPAMVVAGEHDHADGRGDEHAAGHDDGHDDGHDAAPGESAAGHDHGEAVVPPKPYDPTQPIDLGGVEGVTPEQQAKAENLIAVTLLRLPQFADPQVAYDAGYRSIGDAVTGYEHYVNWDLIDDDVVLDPDQPESLVYRVDGDERILEAAMYMLPRDVSLDQVPDDIGGDLVQWHIHDDLCYTPDEEAPLVRGVAPPGTDCPPPLRRIEPPAPMVHVWIVPHPCGPFAALEGVGAGQIAEGEERLCDHAHGA
jgi:hypothetical protein